MTPSNQVTPARHPAMAQVTRRRSPSMRRPSSVIFVMFLFSPSSCNTPPSPSLCYVVHLVYMNSKCLNYLLLCWNVRGLGSSAKCDDICDAISFSSPQIACLQETKLPDIAPSQHPPFLSLPRLSPVRPRHWHSWWHPHSLELQLLLAAKLHITPLLPLCHPLLYLLKQNFQPHQHLRPCRSLLHRRVPSRNA